jgi:hypothetical protein
MKQDRVAARSERMAPDLAKFVVETETMADGRLIHYYRWPRGGAPDGAAAERADPHRPPERATRPAPPDGPAPDSGV